MPKKYDIITPLVSAVRTTTGTHLLGNWPANYDEVVGYLNCTASATPTSLDVDYQTTPDGGTTWFTHSSFTQITTTGTQRLVFTRPAGLDARISYTIVGTSFTFSLSLEGKKSGM